MPLLIDRFSKLAPDYDIVLSDVWGVIHNGVAAFPPACEALVRFREQGGTVVLITNAPRPHDEILQQLAHLGVPEAAYDGIVTSGDVTREVIASRAGQSVFHLGPERDKPVFKGFDLRFADADTADYVVCSGLFDDETETPEDYRGLLEGMRSRNLLMVCGNPDRVVERGAQMIYCAGAIADLYASIGGEVLYAGKPYRPIYDLALRAAQAVQQNEDAAQAAQQNKDAAQAAQDKSARKKDASRVLAIGDSVRTDFMGAKLQGLDCLFVTSGIHSAELGGRDMPDVDVIRKIFAETGAVPRAATHRLAW